MLNLIYDHFAESMDDPVVNQIVVSSQRLFGAFVPVSLSPNILLLLDVLRATS